MLRWYPNELAFTFRNSSWQIDHVNLTGCEQCHDVNTIHNIQYNYNETNGQAGYGHIGENWDCNGCHAFWDAGSASGFEGAIIPSVDSMTPARLSTVDTATTVTITGSDFTSGAGIYTAVVVIDGSTTLTPASVTDTEIVVVVPQLSEGVHTIQVLKQGDPSGDKPGKLGALTVTEPVNAVSAVKSSAKGKTTVTITGSGFGPQPDAAFAELGVTVQTTVTVKGKSQQVTYPVTVTSWSDTVIVGTVQSAKSKDLVTVKTVYGQDSVNVK